MKEGKTMPKQELKFKCYLDSNNCWCATIKLTDGKKIIPCSVAAAPEMKNRAAKSFIKEVLEEKIPLFLKENPTFKICEDKE